MGGTHPSQIFGEGLIVSINVKLVAVSAGLVITPQICILPLLIWVLNKGEQSCKGDILNYFQLLESRGGSLGDRASLYEQSLGPND